MNAKTLLVDLDGVVLHRSGYFSARAKELYPEANHAAVMEFFTGGTYKDVTLGRRDLVEALSEALSGWETGKTVDEVLKDWFDGENTIDQTVLNRIQEIRNSGVKCVLATDHSLYRKEDVWNRLGMKGHFDGIIASADVHATKHDSEFYLEALRLLSVSDASTAIFTDDDPKNVEVAQQSGLQAFVFESVSSLDQVG